MSTIVVPIYIYPLPSAWDPLIQAAESNPHVHFLCIVNPHNGPGADVLPDASYSAVLSEMSQIPNIRTIGYVHCAYGQRPLNLIKADIDKYAQWEAESNEAFRVDGIFIDEAPWEPRQRESMALLARYIRNSWKKRHASGGIVIYNPGVVVDKGYLEDADWTVVFEQSHQHWYDYFLRQGLNQIPPHLRKKTVAMIHSFGSLDRATSEVLNRTAKTYSAASCKRNPRASVAAPAALSGESLAAMALTDQIRQLGVGGTYITEQLGGGYNHWPATWTDVARSIEIRQGGI